MQESEAYVIPTPRVSPVVWVSMMVVGVLVIAVFWSSLGLPSGLWIIAVAAIAWGLDVRKARDLPAALIATTSDLALRLAGKHVVAVGWDELREVRVEQTRFGHRVVAVPRDLDGTLARLPDKARRVAPAFRRYGGLVALIGRSRVPTESIAIDIRRFAAGRCPITAAP